LRMFSHLPTAPPDQCPLLRSARLHAKRGRL
jgi:hypothetical protein